MAVAFAQNANEHIILVTPSANKVETRMKLTQLFGNNLKMQLQSTGEMVVIESGLTLAEVKKKIGAVLPGLAVREVSSSEFVTLKGNQLKGQ